MQNTIKVCNEINRIIVRDANSNELLAYRAFALMKHVDDNSGYISLQAANAVLRMFLGKNYTINVLSRLSESKKYWGLAHNGVYLRSWESLWLEHRVFSPEWCILPATVFRSRKQYKAHAYGAWLDGRMISRAAITESWGFTRPTQIKYERLIKAAVEWRCEILSEEDVLELCSLGELNPNALYGCSEGYTRQLPNKFLTGNCGFTTKYITQSADTREKNLQASDANDERNHDCTVLYAVERHYNQYGQPKAKIHDGAKTYFETDRRVNGMAVMVRGMGTMAY